MDGGEEGMDFGEEGEAAIVDVLDEGWEQTGYAETRRRW